MADCIGSGTGCTPVDAVKGARGLTVAPDGSVYVSTWDLNHTQDSNIVHLSLGSDGHLHFADCLGRLGTTCPKLPADDQQSAGPVVLSPDGHALYTWSVGFNHFALATGGALSFVDCLSHQVSGCADDAGANLGPGGPRLAMSPDGRNLYAATGTVVAFLAR